MTEEQISRQELQREQERMQIIRTKIFYSWDELTEMSQTDKINAMIQMKQDETMKWQRLASQLIYYVTIVSLIIIGLALFITLILKNG